MSNYFAELFAPPAVPGASLVTGDGSKPESTGMSPVYPVVPGQNEQADVQGEKQGTWKVYEHGQLVGWMVGMTFPDAVGRANARWGRVDVARAERGGGLQRLELQLRFGQYVPVLLKDGLGFIISLKRQMLRWSLSRFVVWLV